MGNLFFCRQNQKERLHDKDHRNAGRAPKAGRYSDNADKQNYPNFNLYEEELNTIWYAEWYFSAKIPNIQEVYYRKQGELEDRLDELTAQFQQFQKALNNNN